eukprot:CAMPEP_0175735088 /NCGR_PEP_ID=MMETSP0097-20121207/52722_1 /TAXON_ID=311494 /ORGANISM="Alexandrium monilatum, Strain CCMP3105" /LENGTH=204 /DNA_ID=CAMNT_0017043137 /DNA_START=44 /DNA_END=654 /DNA_ORIENTATION=+
MASHHGLRLGGLVAAAGRRWGRGGGRRLLLALGGLPRLRRAAGEVRGVGELDDLVDQAVLLGLLGRHEVVAHEVLPEGLLRLARHAGVHPDDVALDLQDLLGLDLDVLRLALRPAHGLVDHHAAVGQSDALALFARGQQEGGHGAGKADVDGDHRRLDVLHRVVDRHAGEHRAAGAVDVEVDRLPAVLGVQVQQHPDDLVREPV